VRDIERSIEFWRDVLGFDLAGADGPSGERGWCRVERAGASVMLQQRAKRTLSNVGAAGGEPEATALYFVCADVDAVHRELTVAGLDLSPPVVAEYGMKQLRIPEPDGHEIWFESVHPGPCGE
jgi:catechol 2,3-dioxygenase-like lactoylglutathione lyase family enzyme